jgi:hypothetical protein
MDAHEREYLAAAAGMSDTYGRRAQSEGRWINGRLCNTWAVGDPVTWDAEDGRHAGLVIEVVDAEANTYLIVERVPGRGRAFHELNGNDILPW